jgi:hypothetical protein
METYTHTCRCGAQYENQDEDPYLCPACVEKRQGIAAEIDAKRAMMPKNERLPSDWQTLERGGTIQMDGGVVFSPSGMGLKPRA